ncbi:MAG: hypothetical protein IKI31_06815, partial [Treponema sp.]|nr:hypothetical protein [Treponema sp.]
MQKKTLEYLYEEIFTRYETLQTRVDIALQTGSYNCVSSTIIYMYFIKKQGIQGSAIETPQHAFCTLTIDGKQIDVETTNPHGFNPGVKKPLSQEEPKRKGYYIVPAKNYSMRKQIDDVRLLSLIYENRISELQRQKNDKETIGLSLDACTLQNNSEKAKHLVHQCVSNTAVSYMRNGNIEKGISLVTEAKNTFGDSSLYNDFFLAAVTNLTTSYAKKNDYETAMQKLENYKHLIHEQNYRDILNRLTYNNIVLDVQKLPFKDAYNLIQKN